MKEALLLVATTMLANGPVTAFVVPTTTRARSSFLSTTPTTSLSALDGVTMDWTTASSVVASVQSTIEMAATATTSTASSSISSSSNLLLSFADQGQNLAGIFFQASLLPYLLFVYFLSFRANRIPNLSNFGFQFVLLFVVSTIPSGIISKSTYGTSLANVDWLHGGAEFLLTVANILIVRTCNTYRQTYFVVDNLPLVLEIDRCCVVVGMRDMQRARCVYF